MAPRDLWRSRGWWAAASGVLIAGVGACTLLLNRDATQCNTNADCDQFGQAPVCKGGVCVASGLGPKGCFEGEAGTVSQFENACNSATCSPFNNCGRLGLCVDGAIADAGATIDPPDVATAVTPPPSDASKDAGLPLCSSAGPNLVYITGSSNFPPLLEDLAPLLAAESPPYIPIFQVTNSCTGVGAIFSPEASAHVIHDPVPSPTAKYAAIYNANGTTTPCALGSEGATVDVGESDIFESSCSTDYELTSSIGEALGPIQAIVFAVPASSSQTTISAEAAHQVFGMGGNNGRDGGAAPWTNPDYYYVRNAGTGTQQLIGRSIGVPPAEFWGADRGSAPAVVNLLLTAAAESPQSALAEQSIGILSVDYAEENKTNIRILSYQAPGQLCGYLPDSTAALNDKLNVRNGHYPIWGPVHFYSALNSTGLPSAAAAALVNQISVPGLSQGLLTAMINAYLVPQCAMKVQRSSELGPLTDYLPPSGCTCFFESLATSVSVPDGCQTCTTSVDCPSATPSCNLGFCEVQ